MNEKGKIIEEAWDGNDLKFTFWRIVSMQLMNLWHEVCAIADSITLTSGLYSMQSLYAVIYFKDIVPVYSPVL